MPSIKGAGLHKIRFREGPRTGTNEFVLETLSESLKRSFNREVGQAAEHERQGEVRRKRSPGCRPKQVELFLNLEGIEGINQLGAHQPSRILPG